MRQRPYAVHSGDCITFIWNSMHVEVVLLLVLESAAPVLHARRGLAWPLIVTTVVVGALVAPAAH